MSRLKGIRGLFRAIIQRGYPQAIPLSTANEASTLFNRYLVRAVSTSEHTNVNTASAVASGEVKGNGEPNLADPTEKPVRGGVKKESAERDAAMRLRHEQWMAEHGREYKDAVEKEMRFGVFKNNVEYIESVNRARGMCNLGVNQFADLTGEEFKAQYCGVGSPGSSKP